MPDVESAESLAVDELVEALDDVELPFVLLASLAFELSLAEELPFETELDEVEALSGVIPALVESELELVESALLDDVKLSVLSSLLFEFEFVEFPSAVDLAELLSPFDEVDVLLLSLTNVSEVASDFESALLESDDEIALSLLSEFESEVVASFADEELKVFASLELLASELLASLDVAADEEAAAPALSALASDKVSLSGLLAVLVTANIIG